MTAADAGSDQGPYVKAAFFCDRVLQEPDGVISPIRIVDRITHTGHGSDIPEEMPPFSYRIFAVVMLVPGRARGRHSVRLELENPSGELRMIGGQDLLFEGEDRNVNLITEIQATFHMEGLHWLRVSFDDRPLTRSPLRVIYQRIETAGQTPS